MVSGELRIRQRKDFVFGAKKVLIPFVMEKISAAKKIQLEKQKRSIFCE